MWNAGSTNLQLKHSCSPLFQKQADGIACSVLLAVTAIVVAADPKKPADHGLFLPDQMKWMDAPNALPHRSKLAVLEGDPFKHEL